MNLNPINPLKRTINYITKKKSATILAAALLLAAGLIHIATGLMQLSYAIQTNGIAQATFDKLLTDTAYATIIMLPAVVFFSISYFILESHSYGWKLSIGTFVISAFLTIGNYIDPRTGLAIIALSGAAAIIEIFHRKKTQNKDLSIVTENVAKLGLKFSGIICIAVLIGMIAYIAIRAAPYLSWNFFTSSDWGFSNTAAILQGDTTRTMGGILPFAEGSLLLAFFCEVIAIPLGLGAAIYLSEYSSQNRLTSIVRYFIETLAGIPSVVIGLVGAAVFVLALGWGDSLWGGAISLAFMILPWNIRIAEESLKSVPKSYREAAYALGATKWQTTRNAVLFAATPGIITGVLLGFGAAIGETIVVALTAGANAVSNIGVDGNLSGYSILPPISRLFGTHVQIPSLPIFIWQAPTSMLLNTGAQNLNLAFMQYGIVLAASFYLVSIYLVICGIALIARNYLGKKIKGR